MQGVCAPSRSLEKFPFFFLFRRPFSILLTVAANWFCKEHSHTHQKQSPVMGFRQLSLAFYFCPLKGLKDYQSTGTILKPADWAWSLTFRDEYRQDNEQLLCIQQYRHSYQLLVKRTSFLKVFWYDGKGLSMLPREPDWFQSDLRMNCSNWCGEPVQLIQLKRSDSKEQTRLIGKACL